MSLRDSLKGGLLMLAAIVAFSAPGYSKGNQYRAAAQTPKETIESRYFEYDALDASVATLLFIQVHGKVPSKEETSTYCMVDYDVNGNGILDHRIEMTHYLVASKPAVQYIKRVHKAAANGSGKDHVIENWSKINDDGTLSEICKETRAISNLRAKFEATLKSNKEEFDKYRPNAKRAGEAYKLYKNNIQTIQ